MDFYVFKGFHLAICLRPMEHNLKQRRSSASEIWIWIINICSLMLYHPSHHYFKDNLDLHNLFPTICLLELVSIPSSFARMICSLFISHMSDSWQELRNYRWTIWLKNFVGSMSKVKTSNLIFKFLISKCLSASAKLSKPWFRGNFISLKIHKLDYGLLNGLRTKEICE